MDLIHKIRKKTTINLCLYKEENGFFVCLFLRSFVMRLHAVTLISSKIVMMVEDLPLEVSDTCKCAWGKDQDNLLPHYFLCKKAIGVVRT
jgi:hypothetical protein